MSSSLHIFCWSFCWLDFWAQHVPITSFCLWSFSTFWWFGFIGLPIKVARIVLRHPCNAKSRLISGRKWMDVDAKIFEPHQVLSYKMSCLFFFFRAWDLVLLVAKTRRAVTWGFLSKLFSLMELQQLMGDWKRVTTVITLSQYLETLLRKND